MHLREAASEAVTRYAGMEPGRPVGGTYYLYRTLRSLDLENLEQRLSQGPLTRDRRVMSWRNESRATRPVTWSKN
jgi:hypothetical protein